MIHGYISLSGLISFLIVQSFANSDHPSEHTHIVDMTDWERRQELFGFCLILIMISFVLFNLAGLCLHVSRIYYIDAKKAIHARTLCINAHLAKTSSVAQIV